MDVKFVAITAVSPDELERALNAATLDHEEYVPYGFSLHGVLLVNRVRVSTSFQKFKQRLVTYSILSNTDYYRPESPDDGINATISDEEH